MDECIEHFTNLGFKLIRDTEDDAMRIATLRIFSETEHGEVVIKQTGSNITVKQTRNGIPVVD